MVIRQREVCMSGGGGGCTAAYQLWVGVDGGDRNRVHLVALCIYFVPVDGTGTLKGFL